MRICSAHFEWNDFTTTFFFPRRLVSFQKHSHTVVAIEACESAHTPCFMHFRQILHKSFEVIWMLAQCKSKQMLYSLRNAQRHGSSVEKKESECLLFAFPKVYGKSQWLKMKMQKFASLACKHTPHCLQLFDALHCSPTALSCNTFYYFIFSNICPSAQYTFEVFLVFLFGWHQFPYLLWILSPCTCFVPKFSRDYYTTFRCMHQQSAKWFSEFFFVLEKTDFKQFILMNSMHQLKRALSSFSEKVSNNGSNFRNFI